jgi:hypothetical protein
MQTRNSTAAAPSRTIGVRAVTMAKEPRPSSVTSIFRAIGHGVRRWLVGRRDGVEIVAVQRADFSIIS